MGFKRELRLKEVLYFLGFFLQRNEPNTIRELIKRKVNVNVVNKKNQTPLHIAVGKNYPECVQILLKAEADPSQKVKNYIFHVQCISPG